MKRRLFLDAGKAAVAAAMTACGRNGLAAEKDLASGVDSLERVDARAQTNPAPAPGNLPVPAGAMTFQMEFNAPAQPLLQYNGGPFNPYFVYFGGEPQPEGENGYRWFNDETAVYTTDRYTPAPYNPLSVGAGVLSMTAIRARPNYPNSPKPYLGACLETSQGPWWNDPAVRAARRGFEQKYGYWECRAKVPKEKGLWPAFWLNGGIVRGRRGHGELDIFEMIGDGKIYQTGHDWWASAHAQVSAPVTPAFDHSAGYHTYSLHWTPTSIVWYVDGIETHRASEALVAKYRDLCGPMFVILGLGAGGPKSWAGAPDASTVFPATLNFDYVRAYALAEQFALPRHQRGGRQAPAR